MKYLLDTCVISELTKKEPNQKIIQWIQEKHESDLCLSILTLGEIQKGITKLPESKKKNDLQEWLGNDLLQRFEGRIFTVTIAVAKKWGKVEGETEKKGEKMPAIDSLIAATGIVNDLTVITRNTEDMERSGVKLFNPWSI
jgi:toxin FitB